MEIEAMSANDPNRKLRFALDGAHALVRQFHGSFLSNYSLVEFQYQ